MNPPEVLAQESRTNLDDYYNSPNPALFARAYRHITVVGGTIFGKMYGALSDYHYLDGDQHLLEKIALGRKPGTPLLTFSNHASTLDDPVIVANLISLSTAAQPDKVRWSLCAEDVCFRNRLAASFFYAGKVLPIRRGAGIHQDTILRSVELLAKGDWVHIYPEGMVNFSPKLQIDEGTSLANDVEQWVRRRLAKLGGSDSRFNDPSKLGRLGSRAENYLLPFRWGIGRLMIDTELKQRQSNGPSPLFVPFVHNSMADVMPGSMSVPRPFKQLGVKVGGHVSISDLVDKYLLRRDRKPSTPQQDLDDGLRPCIDEVYASATLRARNYMQNLFSWSHPDRAKPNFKHSQHEEGIREALEAGYKNAFDPTSTYIPVTSTNFPYVFYHDPEVLEAKQDEMNASFAPWRRWVQQQMCPRRERLAQHQNVDYSKWLKEFEQLTAVELDSSHAAKSSGLAKLREATLRYLQLQTQASKAE